MKDVLVVGAGQLGLMMAASAARLGIQLDRIDHHTGEILPGSSNTRLPQKSSRFAVEYDVITAELEHLLGNPLVEGLQHQSNWLNPQAMMTLPARDQQKTLLDQLSVPTSPWQFISEPQDLLDAQQIISADLVVKSIRDGYDGKGQWIVSADNDGDIPNSAYGKVIAEQKIPFKRELSIVGARFKDGTIYCLPLVENYHQQGMLRYTLAPATKANSLQEQADSMFEKITTALDYTGVLAIECFDTTDGLLVNEIAPRVHNSGHWSQLGTAYSQFDLHLLAISGRQTPTKQTVQPSLMLNLIGCQWNPHWLTLPDIQTWWYGKDWRENRKLGHINVSAPSVKDLIQRCTALLPSLDELHHDMLVAAMNQLED